MTGDDEVYELRVSLYPRLRLTKEQYSEWKALDDAAVEAERAKGEWVEAFLRHSWLREESKL